MDIDEPAYDNIRHHVPTEQTRETCWGDERLMHPDTRQPSVRTLSQGGGECHPILY